MPEKFYKDVGESIMTPVDNPQRKTILVSNPKQYSVQADLSDFIGMNSETGKAIDSLPYEFRTPDGITLLKGKTDSSGDTDRIFTREGQNIHLYVGAGDWKLSADSNHETYLSTPSATQTESLLISNAKIKEGGQEESLLANDNAYLDVSVIDMHRDPIANLLVKVLVNKQEVFKGKTDAKGNIPRIENLKPGSYYEIRIKRDKVAVDKKRADADGFMFTGNGKIYTDENFACLASPKNKFELQTERHIGSPGDADQRKEKIVKSHNQTAATNPEFSGNPDKRPEVQASRDGKGLPKAIVVDGLRDWFNRNTMNADAPPVNKDDIEHVNNLIDFGKKQALWDYPVKSTSAIVSSMAAKKFQEPVTIKPVSKSLGFCNIYVKVALWVAGYSNTSVEIGFGIEPAADMGPALVKAGFQDITNQIPDARWAAPGDIIVYRWTDDELAIRRKRKNNPNYKNMGHIDIRTYDGYLSDFFGERLPDAKRFEVTGIYRKYHDPLPDLRVKAMLEIIASRETKGIPKDQSWYALNTPIDGNKFAPSIQKHPWSGLSLPDSIKKGKTSTAAGRYQLTLTAWKEARDVYLFPEDFSPSAQMRLAVLRMEYRKALGLIREGKIEAGVRALTNEWVALPGGVDAKDYTMARLLSEHENLMNELSK